MVSKDISGPPSPTSPLPSLNIHHTYECDIIAKRIKQERLEKKRFRNNLTKKKLPFNQSSTCITPLASHLTKECHGQDHISFITGRLFQPPPSPSSNNTEFAGLLQDTQIEGFTNQIPEIYENNEHLGFNYSYKSSFDNDDETLSDLEEKENVHRMLVGSDRDRGKSCIDYGAPLLPTYIPFGQERAGEKIIWPMSIYETEEENVPKLNNMGKSSLIKHQFQRERVYNKRTGIDS